MGITSHRLPSGRAVRGGLPPSGDRWLRATGGYGRLVANGDDEHLGSSVDAEADRSYCPSPCPCYFRERQQPSRRRNLRFDWW